MPFSFLLGGVVGVPAVLAAGPAAGAAGFGSEASLAETQAAERVFVPLIAAHQRVIVPEEVAPPARNGGDLLDIYRAGDLALAVDVDGEWLGEATSHIVAGDLNWILTSISTGFYRNFDDEYQYVTVLLVNDLGFFGAFYSPMANDVRGIGYDAIVRSEVFDQSDNQLEGFIFMNAAELWSTNRAAGRFVFGQEFMHRWGSFVNVTQEGMDPDGLLGRDAAHWSYWLNTTNSPMEGNAWADNGDGTWTTQNTAASTYSDLDLYLMGLVGPEDVGTQTLLSVSADEQARVGREPASAPEAFLDTYDGSGTEVTVAATPLSFGVDAIVAAEGVRDPSVATSPKQFRMAVVVLVLSSDVVDEPTLAAIDDVRRHFEEDWEADVRGLADLDTTLGAGTAPEWGATVDTGDTASDTGAIEDTGAESDGPKQDAADTGCGCAVAPRAGWLGALTLLALGATRRRSA